MKFYLTSDQYAVLAFIIESEVISRVRLLEHYQHLQRVGRYPRYINVEPELNVLLDLGLVCWTSFPLSYVPSMEAVRGMQDGSVQIATNEQIKAQAMRMGTRARALRQRLNLSINEMAARLNMNRDDYAKVECGRRRFSCLQLRELAYSSHVPLAYFVEEA